MAESEEDTNWTVDLETALLEGCDFGTLRNICKARTLPEHLRAEVWQICLNVAGKGDALSAFDELFDMPEQAQLREDCQNLVDKLGNEEEDHVAVMCDLESILTFYCKSRNTKYETDNGWLEIVQPMLALKLSKSDIYNCFYALITKYIPRECHKNGKPFHLFRLLLQYHDPELCSFLDTRRITPELYSHGWFRSLFANVCDLRVILKMWDVYLQQADPFLVFFLALVMLVNAKEQILTMSNSSKQDIIDTLTVFPSALDSDDIEDFCQLAQYYASRTPQSFRRDYQNITFGAASLAVLRHMIRLDHGDCAAQEDYQAPLFGQSLASQKRDTDVQVSQALCLPVSVHELIENNLSSVTSGVRYFVVDCRPAEQYNAGHLSTAFHLDANLMLQSPAEFATAVQALFDTQKQAIAAESMAGGEHLCFIGSGREEEDQYMYMVVAHFLQKNTQFISAARGGYAALQHALKERILEGLADESLKSCITGSLDEAASYHYESETLEEFHALREQGEKLFDKLSTAVKTKSAIMKEKLTNYIKNEQQPPERHVSSSDRVGKRYRNMASVFSIGDDDEEDIDVPSSDDERKEVVNIETWLNKPDIKYAFQCKEVKDNGYMVPSHLLVTDSHLYILREVPDKKGMAWIQARRALGSIVKITSKKRHPELITFKYGSNDDEKGLTIVDLDRFLIPKAAEATKVIKQQIMKVLDALDT